MVLPHSNPLGCSLLIRSLCDCATVLLFSLCVASFASAGVQLQVQWKNGRLSLSAEQVSLAQVLREVSRKTGMEVRGSAFLPGGKVSQQFTDLPLDEGLKRLLRTTNYALIQQRTSGDASHGTRSKVILVVIAQGKETGASPSPGKRELDDEQSASQARQLIVRSRVDLDNDKAREAKVGQGSISSIRDE
jgi:hypothetical protein